MAARVFEAPGPGTWELDTTHFSKPLSAYAAGFMSDSFVRGFKQGSERYGLLMSHLQSANIHGFSYSKPVLAFAPEDAPPGPPPEGYFEQPELVARLQNGKKAIENKLWREDLKRWDEEVKPDSIRRNLELQAVDPESLNSEELIQHMIDCYENAGEMIYRHHIFTIPSIIPVGLYIDKACQWSGASPGEVLNLLKGSSPVSQGIAVVELEEIALLLRQEDIDADQFSGVPPVEVLQALRSRNASIDTAIENYLHIVGMQLTSGYDITERYALEMPELLVGNIWSALAGNAANEDQAADAAARQTIRLKVPAEYRDEFDSLLDEARFINRLRDERGVYNEARAFGLSRRAVLEAGKRLHAEGRLSQAAALLHASQEEMLALLRGESGVTVAELQEREDWYSNKTTDDVPAFLGPPPEPPPPLEALPEDARPGAAAIGAAFGNLSAPPIAAAGPEPVVRGFAVSAGSYEGTARLIQSPADFQRLQQGDVLITKNTSATFNVVLPMLGAIVTDRGGQLSHAAIIAREYGIPALVGTGNATRVIADGARVRVDGVSGTVEVLS
jgi:phosphohistidine swiveling domain-containing protein